MVILLAVPIALTMMATTYNNSLKVLFLDDKSNASSERELKMQLALVRVMKSRNTLLRTGLIAEASTQLEKYFMPDPKLMRKQIEVLMERGFMRRDADDMRKLHYCA